MQKMKRHPPLKLWVFTVIFFLFFADKVWCCTGTNSLYYVESQFDLNDIPSIVYFYSYYFKAQACFGLLISYFKIMFKCLLLISKCLRFL